VTDGDDSIGPRIGERTGYADVNGLRMYYELHGRGAPLVLLHGGVMTIDLSFGLLIPPLAQSHLVIGVEMQGHGRTADIDRTLTPAGLAEDVVGLLDHLGIDRAHVLGHSMGGATALELAVSHPTRVRSIVVISAGARPDGMHEDLTDPARMATSTRLPTARDFADMRDAYTKLSPHPTRFDDFIAATGRANLAMEGWSDGQLAGISAPTLLIIGDNDFVTVEHAALMKELIPGAYLAVLPNTTHMDATRRPELLVPMVSEFLRDTRLRG
jgi:pimeloyl-ACP methyl ester carboxylesterase